MALVTLPMVLMPAFNMLFLIIVARQVSVSNYGSLAYTITLVALLIGFSDLGLRDFFLSKSGTAKQYSNFSTFFVFSTLIFFVLYLILYVVWVRRDSDLLALLFLSSLAEAYAFGVFHKALYYEYQKDNKLPEFSKVDAVLKVLPPLTKICVFLVFDSLVIAVLSGSLFTFATYTVWILRKRFFRTKFNDVFSTYRDIKLLLSEWRQWGVFTVSFISFFLYFGADKIVVKFFAGTESLAIYAAAMSFIAIGQIAVGVLWSLYMPRLSRGEEIWSYKRFFIYSCLIGFLFVLVYQVFAYLIFGYMYPENYEQSVYIISLSSFYFLFRFPNVVVEIFFIVDGHYSKFVKMRVTYGFLAIILCFALLDVFGLIGAALALVVAEMLLMISSLIERRRLHC